MERTIRVTGKGKIAIKPDTVRLVITQSEVIGSYEGAIRESADKKGALNASLKELGFEESALKTLYFNVDTEYESYQAKDKSWKSRLNGYRYTHRMKFEFPSDGEMLGRVLLAVARCPGKPEFTIHYTISDPEAAKNELLAKAVQDSMTKASVLSKAAGVKLSDILSIDYSWGEIEFITRPMGDLMLEKTCAYSMDQEDGINIDIEADDIEVEDKVTVVWGIVSNKLDMSKK